MNPKKHWKLLAKKIIKEKGKLYRTFLTDIVIEQARDRYDEYSQYKMDLMARLSTNWPKWGVGLDFYYDIILPLKLNTFMFHFINLSDEIQIDRIDFKTYFYDGSKFEEVEEKFKQVRKQVKEEDSEDPFQNLIKLGIYESFQKCGIEELAKKYNYSIENNQNKIVNLRDGLIGAQAFYALFEGIIRNSAKHRRKREDKTLRIRVIFIDAINTLKKVFKTHLLDSLENRLGYKKEQYNYCIITCNFDEEKIYGDGDLNKKGIKIGDKESKIQIINIDNKENNKELLTIEKENGIWKINDKEGLESKLKEKVLSKLFLSTKIDQLLKSPIVDDTGEITEGGWGMKEIKIAAAFLSGKEYTSVQSDAPDYIVPGYIEDKVIWEDEKDEKKRLAYLIKLPKPKYALVLLKTSGTNNLNSKSKKELEKNGFRFETIEDNINELKNISDTDYDFLVIDNKLKNMAEHFGFKSDGGEKYTIERNSWLKKSNYRKEYSFLPNRVIVTSVNGIFSDGKKSKGEVDLKDLDIAPAPEKNLEDPTQKAVLRIYDKWMKSLKKIVATKPENDWGISIFFDDDKKTDDWKGEISENSSAFRKSENTNGKKEICVWRHKSVQELKSSGVFFRGDEWEGQSIFYYKYGSNADLFFSYLYSLNPGQSLFSSIYTLYSIMEMGMLKVLIIDERVAQAAPKIEINEKGKSIKLEEKLYWMGIDFAQKITFPGKIKPVPLLDDEASDRGIEVHFCSPNNADNDNIEIKCYPVSKGKIDYKKEEEYDILLIHQTRYKEIAEKLSKTNRQLGKIFKENFLYVIVHSGRGETPEGIPKNIPFLEYSTIQRFVLRNPSKYYLIKSILALKKGR